MAKSGLESLMDALGLSGMDPDEAFGGKPDSGDSAEDQIAAEVDEVLEDAVAEAEEAGDDNSDFEDIFGKKGARRSKRGFKKGSGDKANGFGGGRGGNGVEQAAAFVEDVSGWSKKRLVIAIILAVLILAGAYWWFHPPINIHSVDFWFVVVILMIILWFFLKAKSFLANKKSKKEGADAAKCQKKAKAFKKGAYVPLVVIAIGLLGWVLSFSIIPGNAEKYSTILDIQTSEFSEDIQQVDYSEIPIIDRSTAVLLGNKEMGTIPEYVSQFEISDLYSQINYKGTPVRVSPLGYADLIKWLLNRSEGLPAYALVNMTTQDAEIVTLPEGQGVKYSESEPLARNIDRYVQLKYPFYMFEEKSFEIDENGHPWWICPVQTRTIGLFGGETISRVVLCDAVTGECQNLALDEVPSWVDRVYPAELLIQQYNWYGSLNGGWLNSWLGQSGVVKTTPGTSDALGYNYIAKDDDVWVYTGVTSVVSDNSIVGFVLINQRTHETHFYSVAGATETSAMSSAEGQVQHLRYSATFPILINVADQPTYFMALKDGEGLVKKFAMVDIKSYQIVAVGDSVAACQANYLELLTENGIDLPDDSDSILGVEISGEIAKIAPVVLNGYSHYYLMVKGDSRLFDFPIATLPMIATYSEGDSITFTYADNNSNPLTVRSIELSDGTKVIAGASDKKTTEEEEAAAAAA